MIVCHCRVVSDREIRAAAESGIGTLGGACRATGAGTVCGGCVPMVRTLLQQYGTPETDRHVLGLSGRLAALRPALEATHAAA